VLTSHQQLDHILAHDSVGGVSFTGSSRAGSFIAQKAGQYLKKSVMELGGNDPFLILIDADLNKAIADAIRARSANCGQVCFSPKRFIIVK
jgi:succinate-semialdehyde dehydrogenase/glutarate-semialdehyde dehydrogenase